MTLRERDPLPGKVLRDTFVVGDRIASGGVSDVYLARQTSVGNRNVAVKVIKKVICASDTEEAGVHLSRFQFEAELLCMLKSGCFARVLEVGTIDDGVERPYMILEYLEGTQLSTYVKRGQRLALPVAVALTLMLGEALEELHRLKVVYRDLSPDNVILEQGGAFGLIPRLFDVSHAVISGIETMDAMGTAGRLLVGTPPYAAPELIRGRGGQVSDVYSLAAVFYSMVVAQSPLGLREPTWEDYAEAVSRTPRLPEKSLKQLLKKVPRDLDAVLVAGMDPRRERRYGTIREFLTDFCEVLLKSPLICPDGIRDSFLSSLIARVLMR